MSRSTANHNGDVHDSARSAGLHYVSVLTDGIHRRRSGHGFIYLSPRKKPIHDPHTLARIKSLVIPPAWQEVCISTDPLGHLQAVGRDQRGRQQYKYHPKWRESRDETKYEKIIDFARTLPKIRSRIRRDLRTPGLSRPKVLATIVQLLQSTLIRVGNDQYARENHSFGLTTLRNRHVQVSGNSIHFEFRGKSGIEHAVDLHDQRLAKIVRACQHLPGQELFQFVDAEGSRHPIASDDVNAYLQEIAGDEFTAKDFRTWAGTVLAATQFQHLGRCKTKTLIKKNTITAIDAVAKELGNTRAVCRKCYIHPAILTAYESGTLLTSLSAHPAPRHRGLSPDECAVLHLLQSSLKNQKRAA